MLNLPHLFRTVLIGALIPLTALGTVPALACGCATPPDDASVAVCDCGAAVADTPEKARCGEVCCCQAAAEKAAEAEGLIADLAWCGCQPQPAESTPPQTTHSDETMSPFIAAVTADLAPRCAPANVFTDASKLSRCVDRVIVFRVLRI